MIIITNINEIFEDLWERVAILLLFISLDNDYFVDSILGVPYIIVNNLVSMLLKVIFYYNKTVWSVIRFVSILFC